MKRNSALLKQAVFQALNSNQELALLLGGAGRVKYGTPDQKAVYPSVCYYPLTEVDNFYNEAQKNVDVTQFSFIVESFSQNPSPIELDSIDDKVYEILNQQPLQNAGFFVYTLERQTKQSFFDSQFQIYRTQSRYSLVTHYAPGNSVLSDGTIGSYVDVPFGLNTTSSDWSMTLILNPNQLEVNIPPYVDTVLISQRDGTGLGQPIANIRTQIGGVLTGTFDFSSRFGGSLITTTYQVTEDNWHKLVMTWNASTKMLRLYAGGELVSTTNLPAISENATGDFVLGANKSLNGNVLHGFIGQFRLFSRTLSTPEIALWSSNNVAPVGSLEVEYLLQTNATPFMRDTSGNSRHGELVQDVRYSIESPFI